MNGLLLLAHGARDPAWVRPFEAVAARVRELSPDTPVVLAFLELMPPDLVNAGAALADAGCSAIKVVPLFLGAGGHVRNDVPRLLQRLRQRCPDLELTLCRAIGEHPLVIEAMARGALE